MTSLKNRIALASFAILGLAHGALPVAAGDRTSIRVAPLKGISVTAGTKQAIGYYVAEKGACNLTLMLSEIFRETDAAIPTATRVSMSVRAGTTTRVDSLEGPALSFTCAPGATALLISARDRVSYVTPINGAANTNVAR